MGIIEKNYAVKIDKFISEIDTVVDNESFYRQRDDFMLILIDVVHAIADCYERKRHGLSSTDDEFLLGFCYLNNQLKHDTKLEVFSVQIYSAVLPLRFPARLGSRKCSLLWADFEDHGSPKARPKRWHYDTHLLDKDVKTTLHRAKAILDSVS